MKVRVTLKNKSYVRTFKHTGDLGDLWYSLPVIKHKGGGKVYLNPRGFPNPKIDGTRSGFSPELIEMARPLLLAQPYVTGVESWHGKSVEVDLDGFRKMGVDYRHWNLCNLILTHFNVPFDDVARKGWIECGKKKVARVVFARSPRYQNPAVNYAGLVSAYRDAVFVGLPQEHNAFVSMFGRVPYYPVMDFLHLAEVINGAELFIGNQSSPMALAIGLGKPYIQEVFLDCPNCVFPRTNARHLRPTILRTRPTVSQDRLDALVDAVLKTMFLPGDMAEFGVFRGGSAAVIAEACKNKTLHLFDTFAGIPERCSEGGHRAGDFSNVCLDDVKETLKGLNVMFHPGFFPDTATGLDDNVYSFVHVDADTYQSTKAALDYFWPRMVTGGIMAFDDWEWRACPGVKKAILEKFPLPEVVISATYQCQLHKF